MVLAGLSVCECISVCACLGSNKAIFLEATGADGEFDAFLTCFWDLLEPKESLWVRVGLRSSRQAEVQMADSEVRGPESGG